jgi:GT2 family glycosyltransferase
VDELRPHSPRQTGAETPFATVIIVNFNSGDRLSRCLDCLRRQTVREFETLVIDNNSTDDSLQSANIGERPVRLIRSSENIGFAAANNRGARDARGKWIALLNPDAYPEPDWFERLKKACEQYPQMTAFGSLQLNATTPETLDGAGDVCSAWGIAYRGGFGTVRDKIREEGECFAPCAAAAMYLREKFLSLGGFDERFFCYGEDVDFGFRLRNAGGKALQVNSAVVLHEGSGVSGRHSAFTVYHGHRNRIWLYYKNMPLALYCVTAPMRIVADVALMAKAAFQGRLGDYLRAIVDGYGGLAGFNEDRKEISRMRKESGAKIAPALSWSLAKLISRAVDLRPIPPQSTAGTQFTEIDRVQ